MNVFALTLILTVALWSPYRCQAESTLRIQTRYPDVAKKIVGVLGRVTSRVKQRKHAQVSFQTLLRKIKNSTITRLTKQANRWKLDLYLI